MFSNDAALVTESPEDLQLLLETFTTAAEELGLK